MNCWIFTADRLSTYYIYACVGVFDLCMYLYKFTDLAGNQTKGVFLWKTSKTNELEMLGKGKMLCQSFWLNARLLDLQKHLKQLRVFRNWNAGHRTVQQLLSGAAQWKSNRIALWEEWVRKGTLWNWKSYRKEEKKKEFSPKGLAPRICNLFQPSGAQRSLNTCALIFRPAGEKRREKQGK